MKKNILYLFILLYLSGCSAKAIYYVAWGEASKSNTQVTDDSKKDVLKDTGI